MAGRMTALDLCTTADPTVLGPTVLDTGGSEDADGAGLAPQSLAVGDPADGERVKTIGNRRKYSLCCLQ
jgi:hypothetical protein